MKKSFPLCMGCMTGISDGNKGICKNCGYRDGTPNPDAYLSPETFLANRYIVGKLISYNGEGALYLGFDSERGIRVTIKEFMPDMLCSRNKGEEFVNVRIDRTALYKSYLNEFAELHKTLKKAKSAEPQLAVQNIIDVFDEFDTAYAVFEYIEGENLKTALTGENGKIRKIKPESAKKLFLPVIHTINALNEYGMVHRAINPSALIIGENEDLKIVSFGITAARTYGSAINYEIYPGYAAPELYDKSARHGSWTDVYGIAAVLYTALTGVVPGDAISRAANDETINPAVINPKIPPGFGKAIMQGLALKSNMRIQTAAEFAEKLWDEEKIAEPQDILLIRKPDSAKVSDNPRSNGEMRKEYAEANPAPKDKILQKVTILKKLGENDFKAIAICAVIAVALTGIIIIISYMATHGRPQRNIPSATESTTEESTETAEVTSPHTAPASDSASEPAKPKEVVVLSDFKDRVYDQNFQQNYNLLKFKVIYQYNSSVQKNIIFGQDIPPKTEVEPGTEITLAVSRGPSVVPLPDYTGKTLKDYLAILTNAGIKFKTEEAEDDTVPANTVVSCDFQAGSPIRIAIDDIAAAPETSATDANTQKIDVVTVFYAKENFRKITSPPEELKEEDAEEDTGN